MRLFLPLLSLLLCPHLAKASLGEPVPFSEIPAYVCSMNTYNEEGETVSSCTAEVISKYELATAGHCLLETPGYRSRVRCRNGFETEVKPVLLHPDFDRQEFHAPGGYNSWYDQAIFRSELPIPIAPARIPPTLAALRESIRLASRCVVAGFGGERAPGTFGDFSATLLEPEKLQFRGLTIFTNRIGGLNSGSSVPGDSGGGLLCENASGWVQVGVVSGGGLYPMEDFFSPIYGNSPLFSGVRLEHWGNGELVQLGVLEQELQRQELALELQQLLEHVEREAAKGSSDSGLSSLLTRARLLLDGGNQDDLKMAMGSLEDARISLIRASVGSSYLLKTYTLVELDEQRSSIRFLASFPSEAYIEGLLGAYRPASTVDDSSASLTIDRIEGDRAFGRLRVHGGDRLPCRANVLCGPAEYAGVSVSLDRLDFKLPQRAGRN
jgi:hypothetical protein